MKYAQLVIGPAGSGKSTFCSLVQKHCESVRRSVYIVNLDPGAEKFSYTHSVDIRDLISVDNVQEDDELKLGPNGSLVFCMEYFIQNMDWLHDQMNETDDDYYLFDCPGQIELYSHLSIMRSLVDTLKSWEFNVCATFILDTHFILDPHKFLGGALTTLSAMTPSVNVLSKVDLLSAEEKRTLDAFLEADSRSIIEMCDDSPWNSRHLSLTRSIASVIDDFSLVKFIPLDIDDDESISDLLLVIDNSIQYGEDLEVRDRYPDELEDLNGIRQSHF